MVHITVTEHARLSVGPRSEVGSLERATISASAFDWLCQESERLRRSGAALVQVESRRWLRLDNYVGIFHTPCGTTVEVLPKTIGHRDEIPTGRRVLKQMLIRCLDLPYRESGPASLDTFNLPLTEWVMRAFLDGLGRLVQRGIRFDYRSIREQQRFLRGRLCVGDQLRQPPGKEHIFCVEHDVFDADRPENRLLKSALMRVCGATRDPRSWRSAHELAVLLAPIPASRNQQEDFRRWRTDRLMSHYAPVRPWCALILNEETPLTTLGEWRANSLLFPMERVFERFVGSCLRTSLPQSLKLLPSRRQHSLCRHLDQDWFNLIPDFLVAGDQGRWVVDAKWKMLDSSDRAKRYGLSQSDFYQLSAYGQHYLGGAGDMLLIYPATPRFAEVLPVFELSSELRLWVVPVNLESGALSESVLPCRHRPPYAELIVRTA